MPADVIAAEFEEIEIGDIGRRRGCDGAIDESREKAITDNFQDFLQDGQLRAAGPALSRREASRVMVGLDRFGRAHSEKSVRQVIESGVRFNRAPTLTYEASDYRFLF